MVARCFPGARRERVEDRKKDENKSKARHIASSQAAELTESGETLKRIILTIVLVIAAAMALFPPWQTIGWIDGKQVGPFPSHYHFLFRDRLVAAGERGNAHYDVDLKQLAVQLSVVLLLGGALALALPNRRKVDQ